VLLTLICISVARGCMCGVFMEQASRKPTAVKTSDVNNFSFFLFVGAQENTNP
jgi:F0F1-type ATP synthase membrane subunit c/vacuolar-type H+-ATPase subunit K